MKVSKTPLTLVFSLMTLCSIWIMGCEKEDVADVNQDKVWTDYELFYDANNDVSWVIARFKFGGPTGTNLELTGDSYVLFNNDTIPYNPWFLGHQKEYAGRITTGTFKYENLNGDIFENTLPSCDTIAFPTDFDTLRTTSAYTLNWLGTPTIADQSVGIFIGSWTWGQDALYVQSSPGATSVVMGTAQLSTLPVGPSTVYMDRSTEKNVTQGTSEGGKIRAKYRAKTKVVQVVN